MKEVTSISGGRTSAYLAANFPTEYNVFALVRTDDQRCLFPDPVLRRRVEDRIQKPFIGTLEDDLIIYTIFDLEQFLGKEITWVSGITFDEVLKGGGWLPNKLHRYCTTFLKLTPIFYWWAETIGEPILMNLGYRANEGRRVSRMNDKLNENGLLEFKATFEKHSNGNNKWELIEWQKPNFPLADNGILKDQIELFWQDRPGVRFAKFNNCVGCFHRNPIFLKKMFEAHPNKMEWFENQEGDVKKFWRSDVPYRKIRESNLQIELSFDDFNECDNGYCGL